METFKSFLNEMAIPRASDLSKVYYHGTKTEKEAASIYHNGLDPSHTILKWGNKNGALKPQVGDVYITSDLSYAMIYAYGGNMFGSAFSAHTESDIKQFGELGFVFEIDNKSLIDIGPDEDSVGELVHKYYGGDRTVPYGLISYAERHATDKQMKDLKFGYYSAWAAVGKKMNKAMPDNLKLAAIDAGAHIAHKGRLKISKCWSFSRRDVEHIKKDGSNFFQYAKAWKP